MHTRPQIAEWYFADNSGRPHGPVSWPELHTAAHAGNIDPDTWVWRVGMVAWVHARAIPGLFAPPPLPVRRAEDADRAPVNRPTDVEEMRRIGRFGARAFGAMSVFASLFFMFGWYGIAKDMDDADCAMVGVMNLLASVGIVAMAEYAYHKRSTIASSLLLIWYVGAIYGKFADEYKFNAGWTIAYVAIFGSLIAGLRANLIHRKKLKAINATNLDS